MNTFYTKKIIFERPLDLFQWNNLFQYMKQLGYTSGLKACVRRQWGQIFFGRRYSINTNIGLSEDLEKSQSSCCCCCCGASGRRCCSPSSWLRGQTTCRCRWSSAPRTWRRSRCWCCLLRRPRTILKCKTSSEELPAAFQMNAMTCRAPNFKYYNLRHLQYMGSLS